jgi:conjugal transfer pilus assembly protein TraV
MKTYSYFLYLFSVLVLSGCSTLNPYDEKADCPDPYNGSCISTPLAYKRSKVDPQNEKKSPFDPKHDSPLIKERDSGEVTDPVEPKKGVSEEKGNTHEESKDTYKNALYEEIAGLAQRPMTPVRVQAKQMRVLILGYDLNDRFYSHRFIFFQGDKPHWILNVIEE